MPHLRWEGVTLGWLGDGGAWPEPSGMTILLHPTAYRAATDEQLVDLVRAGDDRAFDAIHARYEQRLIGYARHMLGGAHHDAEEVVQDAFVRALTALRADAREMALKPWLYTIVRNRALDGLRRPVRTTDLELHAPVLHDASADPHERVTRAEDLRNLVGDLQQLPERQRTALVMHELGGASHETIARRLHVSAGGSKALVCRARAGLAKARAAAA
jgi:RNA polymerase sigma-70 factor, ECF subfamily